jgi:protein-S-isoprenylcysteine O-methyltransferase Ste14
VETGQKPEESEVSLQNLFHSVATGPKKRRELFTPVGLTVFGGSLAIVIFGGLLTDKWFRIQGIPPSPASVASGSILLSIGAIICGWCVLRFFKSRGTPVPFNPPEELIQTGLYGKIRNPMLTGVFLALFGIGLLLHSLSMVLIWTPGYILVHVLELKLVEDPELERRFGPSYAEYRRRVPMFFPRFWRQVKSNGGG